MQRTMFRLPLAVVAALSMHIVDAESALACRRCRRARATACYRPCTVAQCQASPSAAPDPCGSDPSCCPAPPCPAAEIAPAAADLARGYCLCVRQRFAYIPPLHYHMGRRYPCCGSATCCSSFLPCQIILGHHVTSPQDCLARNCEFEIPWSSSSPTQESKKSFADVEVKLPEPLPADIDVGPHLMPGWQFDSEKMGWVILPNGLRVRVKLVTLKSTGEEAIDAPPERIGFGFEVEDDGTDDGFPETHARSHLGNQYQHQLTVDGRHYFIVTSH